VLFRLFELRDGFFIDPETPFARTVHLNDCSWLAMLTLMANIFTHLNALEEGITIFNVEGKIKVTIQKLELCSRRL
jgi:hypothetical protein